MNEERETWIEDVNEDFQGKDLSDPAKGFFDIVAQHYDSIFNSGWGEEEDDDGEPGLIKK